MVHISVLVMALVVMGALWFFFSRSAVHIIEQDAKEISRLRVDNAMLRIQLAHQPTKIHIWLAYASPQGVAEFVQMHGSPFAKN